MKLTLKDVRLVPDLRVNLLFIGNFDEEYISCFGERHWKAYQRCICSSKRNEVLYSLQNPISLGERRVSMVEETSIDLWHKWLGHMSEKRLQALERR